MVAREVSEEAISELRPEGQEGGSQAQSAGKGGPGSQVSVSNNRPEACLACLRNRRKPRVATLECVRWAEEQDEAGRAAGPRVQDPQAAVRSLKCLLTAGRCQHGSEIT